MIGLVDLDLYQKSSATELYYPNIEIMKLASYYKLEERQFCRLLDLDEENLKAYDKIFLFSEQDRIMIPDNFKRAKNIIYGGTAFTKKIYLPFENELIDYTLPRTSIYKSFLAEKYKEGIKSKDIDNFLDNTYYRMYAGKNKLPVPAIRNRKRVILYDRDFFYPDWKECLNFISDKNPSKIIRVHPVFCNTLTQFFEVRNFQKFSRGNEIVLDLKIPLEDLNFLFKKYELKFLADINSSSNVFFPFGGSLQGTIQYYQDLIYILNILYSFWSRGIEIKLKFIEPKIGFYNPFINLSKLIEKWSYISVPSKKNAAIINKIKKKSIEQEQLKEFIKYFPKAEDLFNQTFNDLKDRRYWRI